MTLIGRLQSLYGPPLPAEPNLFIALIQEYAAGKMTSQQAFDALGIGGDPESQADLAALYSLVLNGKPGVLFGTDPLQRAFEVEHVLSLSKYKVPPYDTEAAVRVRLGMP